mmetsp:Transcript_98224/g.204869  ORF Transcript_98224/g.204869 Transcript_98224/m.204869 type:complete len:137 (+) Transcript_98224:90-500(+)|eukprot:CAMPEP_0206439306 /NCGR_PEP_ID=MMETSP0324_2-20121206/12132_1 /ASSEMBLY_ACC=CAM_ASM_000836 /TAXON_ID=2866 /ORGANISM="Crypthecodinium cohnii, Strain Seligo" /LENGTH=136 /DNA_ID=CAMNT_0053906901 /DNA_START=86 /DNA_END=496 /DNA_ORIENTATION=+
MFACCCGDPDGKKDVDHISAVSVLKDDTAKAFSSSAIVVEHAPPTSGSYIVTMFRIPTVEDPKPPKIGLDIARVENALKIKRICPGVVQDFNESNPESALRVGDLIIGVNGVTGPGNELLAAIGTSQRLEFHIHRP